MKFLTVFFLVASMAVEASPCLDSIGIKTIKGKPWIIHQVDKKETWFALSRRYNLTPDSLKFYNPAISNLKTGIQVIIPLRQQLNDSEKIDAAHANADAVVSITILKHKVMKGESASKIAGLYGISTSDLQKWNGLKEGKLEVGQVLIVNAMGARSPKLPWNKPLNLMDTVLPIRTTSSIELITESGQAMTSDLCRDVCMKSTPPGKVAALFNPTNQLTYIGEVSKVPALDKLFIGDVVVIISPEIAFKLGYKQPAYPAIKITYPSAE